MGIERDGDKLRIDYIRYDFVRGEHKHIVREISTREVFKNNALMQHLMKAPRNGRPR